MYSAVRVGCLPPHLPIWTANGTATATLTGGPLQVASPPKNVGRAKRLRLPGLGSLAPLPSLPPSFIHSPKNKFYIR